MPEEESEEADFEEESLAALEAKEEMDSGLALAEDLPIGLKDEGMEMEEEQEAIIQSIAEKKVAIAKEQGHQEADGEGQNTDPLLEKVIERDKLLILGFLHEIILRKPRLYAEDD